LRGLTYTRPARPPERGKLRRTAGGLLHLGWGRAEIMEEPPVVTGTGAGCTSGACSLVQNTAFPGRACSRKGGSGGGQRRQPAPGKLQGPRGWNCRVHSGTAGGGGGRNVLIAVLESLAIWNSTTRRRSAHPKTHEITKWSFFGRCCCCTGSCIWDPRPAAGGEFLAVCCVL
jgi:hypothetical protein